MLINCAAHQDGKKLADIAVEDIGQWPGNPHCVAGPLSWRFRRSGWL
jgi:hypothetical protein